MEHVSFSRIYRLAFLLLFLTVSLRAQEAQKEPQQQFGGTLRQLTETNSLKNTSFLLTKLTYTADIPFSKEEFLYLTQLPINSFITLTHINKAYKNLLDKKRFSSIDINISDEGMGKHLEFKFTGNWILKKFIFRGIIFGKQLYTNLYTQQPGDLFDITVHEESLQTIKKYLHDQGYLACKLTDELHYSKKNKTITVKLYAKQKRRFIIKKIDFDLSDSDPEKIADINLIKQELYKNFQKSLITSFYDKNKIEKQARKIQRFLKDRGFLHSHLSMDRTSNNKKFTVFVTFNITLGKQKKLHFMGNNLFTEKHIKESIIGLEQPDWLFAPDIITEQLLYEYYKKGYWDTDITNKKLDNQVLSFIINEKKPVLVEKVIMYDVTHPKKPEPTFFWKKLLENKILDQTILDKSIEELKNFYFSNGFWNFTILEKKIIKNKHNEKYSIKLLIKKGQQHFWGGFSIKKHHKLEKHEFFKKYITENTDYLIPFNMNWLRQQKIYLLNYFQKLGYWYVKVKPHIHLYPVEAEQLQKMKYKHATKVFINWNIVLGPRVRFGKLVIRGNSKLPFKRIIKEVKFKEGDLWSKEKLELTRKKLKRLGIFKQIQIHPYQITENKSKKPVILNLVDDDQLELRLRAGYYLTNKNFLFKRQSTPKVGAGMTMKNITNRADNLDFDTFFTRFERKCETTYQQPSIFRSSHTGKFSAYANKYIQPVQIGSSHSAYEAEQTGFLGGLSDEFKDNYHWGLTAGNEWIKTSRVRGNMNLDPSLINKTIPYLFVEPSFILDKRDETINTTKGTLTYLALKAIAPYTHGSITSRFTAEQSLFYPVYDKIILAARLRFGHLFSRHFNQVQPIERFYLGGPYSVRGYEKDSLPPLGKTETIDENGNKTEYYTIQGGSSMMNGNLELRIPILKNFGTVLFQDFGVLSQSSFAGLTKRWYPSSGFGARYQTPVGAIRFDIGWKWKRFVKDDCPYAWYLTLGEAF